MCEAEKTSGYASPVNKKRRKRKRINGEPTHETPGIFYDVDVRFIYSAMRSI